MLYPRVIPIIPLFLRVTRTTKRLFCIVSASALFGGIIGSKEDGIGSVKGPMLVSVNAKSVIDKGRNGCVGYIRIHSVYCCECVFISEWGLSIHRDRLY